MMLPKLAAEVDPSELKRKVIERITYPIINICVYITYTKFDEISTDVLIFIFLYCDLRTQTVEHLESYDDSGKRLFLQTLKLMRKEMLKRYQNVGSPCICMYCMYVICLYKCVYICIYLPLCFLFRLEVYVLMYECMYVCMHACAILH